MSSVQQPLPVKTLSNGDVVVEIADGTTPSQKLAVDAAGKITVKLDDAAGNGITSQANGGQQALDVGIDVGGVQIDPRQIRALTAADIVTVDQGTSPWVIGDGGGSITVDGTVAVSNLPATVDTNYGTVGANTIRSAAQIGNATGAANFNNGATGAQTLRVAANLAVAGADVTALNPVPVSITSALAGTPVNKYNTTAAVAAGASTNHDYTITAGKTFYGKKFFASSAGMIRADVQTSPDGAVFTTFWTGFTSTAFPTLQIDLDQLVIVDSGVGAKIRIIVTNFEATQAEDLFSTISGTEI